MAASANDLFMEVGDPGTATTLSAPGYTASDTVITVGSTSGWPTATGVIFAIDEAEIVDGEEVQVAGTYNEFEGVVNSGTSVTSVDWVRGVGDRNYAAGALTRVYIPVSAERENRLVDGMTREHDQFGAHIMVTPQVTTSIDDTNGNELIKVSSTASAVNEFTVTNAATGGAPKLSATGGDTNINLEITPKGTGRVVLNGAGAPTVARVATSETTTSTSFADLATTTDSVTVTIGASGIALVKIGATLSNNTADSFNTVSFEMSGANTLAAGTYTIQMQTSGANRIYRESEAFLLTGLNAGSTTFKMKYRVTTGGGGAGTMTASVREIWVEPK